MSKTKLLIIASAVVVAAGLIAGYFVALSPTDKVNLTADQQELVDEAGYPDTFVIMFEGDHRDEIWNYYSMRASFYFSDGDYVRADNTLEPLPHESELPDFKPTSFPTGIELADVEDLTPDDKPISAKYDIEGLGHIEGRQYEEGLFVGLAEGELTYIQTQAFTRAEQ